MNRNTAYIISIKNLNNSTYVKTDEGNYLNFNGTEVSKVNIIGTILNTAQQIGEGNNRTITIDDGTGNIQLTTFDKPEILEKLSPGDIVLVIGRVREWNNNKYVTPDIIKNIENRMWIQVRKKQLEQNQIEPAKKEEEPTKQQETIVEEDITEDINEEEILPQEEIVAIVKELDSGDGADIDEVIKKINKPNGEQLIENMLREGDLFQPKAGKVKPL